jgi:UDP-3-O-[3-hydroxymyristoyl] N-acetylglucosamine deacetylase
MRMTRNDSVAVLSLCEPEEEPVYTVILDYVHPGMGDLTFTFRPFADDFAAQVAPARTFALEEEVPDLFRQGLAAGGGLHNALVIGREGPLNPGGMRFLNEPARHKMLDLLGDLALLGALPHAHLRIEKPGHGIHHALVRSIAASL